MRRGDLHELGLPADGAYFRPEGDVEGGVLVLSGSSGRIETGRAALFAEAGLFAVAMRWFGGPGQPPGICEVPLETFAAAVDVLARHTGSIALVGVSKGAEAALLVASDDPRVSLVTAMAPSSVVWASVGPGEDGESYPYRTSWTRGGARLPFVAYDESWEPAQHDGPTSFRELYLRSMDVDPVRTARAAIPVDRIKAQVIVSAGLDDQVWPSDIFSAQVATRRTSHGKATQVITHKHAGHRALFPGEKVPESGQAMARGGNEDADRELGAAVWSATLRAMGIGPNEADLNAE